MRAVSVCPVFGVPKRFKDNVLPIYADVVRNSLYIRETFLQANKQEPSLRDVCNKLISDLKFLWEKSSIPIVSDQQVRHKIKQYHQKYRNIKKPLKKDGKINTLKKVVAFREDAEKNYLTFHCASVKIFQIAPVKLKYLWQNETFYVTRELFEEW